MNKQKRLFVLLILLVQTTLLFSQENYQHVFRQVKTLCDRDGGYLWGINMYSPVLLIDSSRTVWGNEADNKHQLIQTGRLYKGLYPEDKIVANSTTEVYGKKWVMIMLPLPEEEIEQNILFIHEMFHYWQDSLKLIPLLAYNNAHLDNEEARIWLKLEWKALSEACRSETAGERQRHIEAGLSFRLRRHLLYPEYVDDETAFELHEGLPQYTGLRLSCLSDSLYLKNMEKHLTAYMYKDNYIRSFAYQSGEIYGYLLDKTESGWRGSLTRESDLGQILLQSSEIVLSKDLVSYCDRAKEEYGFDEICRFERERSSLREQEKVRFRALFGSNTLSLRLRNMNISFDPNHVIPLEGLGTIYPKMRIVDDWGILEITDGGCLISSDWTQVTLPYYDRVSGSDRILQSKGWTLKLNPGVALDEIQIRNDTSSF